MATKVRVPQEILDQIFDHILENPWDVTSAEELQQFLAVRRAYRFLSDADDSALPPSVSDVIIRIHCTAKGATAFSWCPNSLADPLGQQINSVRFYIHAPMYSSSRVKIAGHVARFGCWLAKHKIKKASGTRFWWANDDVVRKLAECTGGTVVEDHVGKDSLVSVRAGDEIRGWKVWKSGRIVW